MRTFHSVIYESFMDIPPSWRGLCSEDDLAMDLRVLRSFEQALAGQFRCWGIILCDSSGAAVACAAVCAFRLRWMNILFCGLPVPAGATHFRIPADSGAAEVIKALDRALEELAIRSKSHLIVIKELQATATPVIAELSHLGYVGGSIPPMHCLDGNFASFADYKARLKTRYRAQIERSQKKLLATGFEIFSGRGYDFFIRHFNEETHQLYVAVQSRAKHKLELLPSAFFHALARELDQEVVLTLIRRDRRVCAFTFTIQRQGVHYNLYSGLDYALNNTGDLYFNLFYNDMDHAFRAHVQRLHLGQTSDTFKSRLGTYTQPLYFYARTPWRTGTWLLRLAAPLAFPKVAPVPAHHVFATHPG